MRQIAAVARAILAAAMLVMAFSALAQTRSPYVVIGYVTSWSDMMPNPHYVTHLNYSFAHVTDTFDGVRVDNPDRLRKIVGLRKENPDLKVLVSVGGWQSGRFSEMAANPQWRMSFARDCARMADEFSLDGIDIDWEFPTDTRAGISHSPDDIDNFTLLMRDLRKALGKKRLLTLATSDLAIFYDLKAVSRYADLFNIMSYDMGEPPYHHSTLYRSELSGESCSEEAVDRHLERGVPKSKLVMGVPFYGLAAKGFPYRRNPEGLAKDKRYTEKWDDTGMVPYWTDETGTLVFSPENVRSLSIKCEYIKKRGLKGVMYWEAAEDTPDMDYARTLSELMLDGKTYTDSEGR